MSKERIMGKGCIQHFGPVVSPGLSSDPVFIISFKTVTNKHTWEEMIPIPD